MTVAADPDPFYALPTLYGASPYPRVPRCVPEAERPLNPDDLPIAAEQTDEERWLAEALQASGAYPPGGTLGPFGAGYGLAWSANRPSAAHGSNGANGATADPGPNGSAAPHSGTSDSNGAHGPSGGHGDAVGGRRFSLRTLTERLGARPK